MLEYVAVIVGSVILVLGVGAVCLIGLCAIAGALLGGAKDRQKEEEEDGRNNR